MFCAHTRDKFNPQSHFLNLQKSTYVDASGCYAITPVRSVLKRFALLPRAHPTANTPIKSILVPQNIQSLIVANRHFRLAEQSVERSRLVYYAITSQPHTLCQRNEDRTRLWKNHTISVARVPIRFAAKTKNSVGIDLFWRLEFISIRLFMHGALASGHR